MNANETESRQLLARRVALITANSNSSLRTQGSEGPRCGV